MTSHKTVEIQIAKDEERYNARVLPISTRLFGKIAGLTVSQWGMNVEENNV